MAALTKEVRTEQTCSKCWDCTKARATKCLFHSKDHPWEARLTVPKVVIQMPLGGLGGKIGYKVIECDHFEASTRTAQPEEPKTITDLKIKTEIPETHDKLVVEMPVPKIKTRKPLVSTKSKANPIENKCSKRPERPVDTMIEQKRCIVCGEPSKGDCCGSPVCKIFFKSLRKKVAN